MLLPLLLAAATAPPASPSPAAAQDWVRLPQPALTRPSAIDPTPREVRAGVHLPSLPEMEVDGPARRATEVPLATVLELVDGAVRAAVGRVDLRVEAVGDGLVLAGDAGGIRVAREVLAELDALERALRIDLDVVLVGAEGERSLGRWTGRSGDRIGVGTRAELPYLGRYDVNLAADSAATEPETWTAWTGTTVHLSAARWTGDAVLVEGHLDLATLRGIETFDPDDVDLGRIELPELDVVEVVFAGLARPGNPLRVSLAGLPEGLPSGTLEVRPRPLAPLPVGAHWHALDLAALAWPAGLPGAAPRDRGEEEGAGDEDGPPAVAPATLALLLEERGLEGGGLEGGGLGAGPLWTEALLFVPPAAGGRAEALLEALRSGLEERRIRAVEGSRRIEFPALAGRPVRLVVGHEHNRLDRYRAQVAPEAWVLEPIVDRRHVGLLLEGALDGASFRGLARARRTVDDEPLSARFTGSSALQRAGRRSTSAGVALEVGAGVSAWDLDGFELRLEIE